MFSKPRDLVTFVFIKRDSMIHSMTGYGKSVIQLPTKKITIEIKSLNSKNLDLNARMPSIYRSKELNLRKLIGNQLERGKIDFNIYMEMTGGETTTQLNDPVVKEYMKQLRSVVDGDETELLKMAVRFPDALVTDRNDIDEDEWSAIQDAVHSALSKIDTYRSDEGRVLESDFRNRVKAISELLDQVVAMDPERIEAVRERLRKGIDELKENIDENRFEQELIYYIEKFDITEEKVRLNNHLEYFLSALDSDDSNGHSAWKSLCDWYEGQGSSDSVAMRAVNTLSGIRLTRDTRNGVEGYISKFEEALQDLKETGHEWDDIMKKITFLSGVADPQYKNLVTTLRLDNTKTYEDCVMDLRKTSIDNADGNRNDRRFIYRRANFTTGGGRSGNRIVSEWMPASLWVLLPQDTRNIIREWQRNNRDSGTPRNDQEQ